MAGAIDARGAYYDTRASDGSGYGGPVASFIGFASDAVRGMCAGLLALLGGMHITGAAAPAASYDAGFEPLSGLLQQLSVTGFSGPAELIGGVILFLTARRAIARTLGLLAFIAFLLAYANGYSLSDMLTALSSLLAWASGALDQAAVQSA